MTNRNRLPRIAPACALACLLTACGSGGGDASAPVDAAGAVERTRAFLLDTYYWADLVPVAARAAPPAATPAAEVERLRARPVDRYSFVEPRAAAQTLLTEGRSTGLGIVFVRATDRLRLRLVQPESPAAAAGLSRGDAIVAIDGQPVTTLLATGGLDAALGPATAGVTLALDVERAGARRRVTLTKADYAFRAVTAQTVLADGGRQVGYVQLSGFTLPAVEEWRLALGRLAAAGAQDLVLDLRHNGGGRLDATTAVASGLAPAAADGRTFLVASWNAANRGRDQALAFDGQRLLAPARIVALTSRDTCSAAEALINGLSAWTVVERVGESTCGKPVGFAPLDLAEQRVNIVSFALVNRDGAGAYFDGLAPRCRIADDDLRPPGDPADPLLSTALSLLRTGTCPAGTAQAGGVVTRSLAPALPYRGPMPDLR